MREIKTLLDTFTDVSFDEITFAANKRTPRLYSLI